MEKLQQQKITLTGTKGTIVLECYDSITKKFIMLFEGQCQGLGADQSAKKFGYTRQHYYRLLHQFEKNGVEALDSKKRGPRTKSRRTGETVRQIIRHQFLDPEATVDVITQKLVQSGITISKRSVERVITEYGLQKKTPFISSSKHETSY